MSSGVPLGDIDRLISALPASLVDIARKGELRRYRKGVFVFEEGSSGDSLSIILHGQLKVFSADPRSDREIVFGVYGPGEYIGEMSLDGGTRSASVIAMETTLCSFVTRRTVEQHIAEQPQFAFVVLSKVIRRARQATLTARHLALNDSYGRLRSLLESLARPRQDGSIWIEQRVTHKDMAAQVGCSREMVTRLLNDLAKGGHLDSPSTPFRINRRLPERW